MLSALPEATWYSTQVKWVSVIDLIRRCSLGKSEKSFASPYLKEINCQEPRWEAPVLGVCCWAPTAAANTNAAATSMRGAFFMVVWELNVVCIVSIVRPPVDPRRCFRPSFRRAVPHTAPGAAEPGD